MNAIKECGTKNPVFLFDEVDKIGADYKEILLLRCWKYWIRNRTKILPITIWKCRLTFQR